MHDEDFSDTIAPKSDQLNADDLLTGPITVTITGVSRGTPDQPINVAIDGGHMPYRPAKSMRRVMVAAWGANGSDWVGKRLTLFCDPAVTFGGVALGGIRISHMSGISGPLSLMLTTTRSKRKQYTVEPLIAALTYPEEMFEENLPKWSELIAGNEMTAEEIITRCEKRAPMTDDQKKIVKSCG